MPKIGISTAFLCNLRAGTWQYTLHILEGLRRAADFSWTRSAAETLDFLRGVGSA